VPCSRRGRIQGHKKARSFQGAGRGSREHANSPGRSPGADDIKIAKKIDSGNARVHVCIIMRWSGFVKEGRVIPQLLRPISPATVPLPSAPTASVIPSGCEGSSEETSSQRFYIALLMTEENRYLYSRDSA
jgi:hypothetical protein